MVEKRAWITLSGRNFSFMLYWFLYTFWNYVFECKLNKLCNIFVFWHMYWNEVFWIFHLSFPLSLTHIYLPIFSHLNFALSLSPQASFFFFPPFFSHFPSFSYAYLKIQIYELTTKFISQISISLSYLLTLNFLSQISVSLNL